MVEKMKSNMNKKSEDKGCIFATHLSGGCMKWQILLSGVDLHNAKNMFLYLENIKSSRNINCNVLSIKTENRDKAVIEIDVSPLAETIKTCRTNRWRASLSYKNRDKQENHLLVSPNCGTGEDLECRNDIFERRLNRVENPIGAVTIGKRAVEIVPAWTKTGEWRLYVADRSLRYAGSFKCIGLKSKIKHKHLYFTVACPIIEGFECKGMVLSYRHQHEHERLDYYYPADKVEKKENCLIVKTDVNLTGREFRPINWEVMMVFEKGNEEFWGHVKSTGENRRASKITVWKSSLKGLFTTQSTPISGDLQLSIGETAGGSMLVVVQNYTRYSGFLFRLKERAAVIIYLLFRKKLRRKNIHLVFEKFGLMAQDNAFYYFKYCMENNIEKAMNRSIYYLIDKKQNDYIKVKPYKNHVIHFMSLKHMVYVLAAKLLISSDAKLHAYAWRATESIIRNKIISEKKNVFLQHGVIGFKVVNFKNGGQLGANLFITSNETEKGFIVDSLGYSSDQVVVTGLSRWDVLEDKSDKTSPKRILVMPTWRKGLEERTAEIFIESEYYKKYMQLINSNELYKFLEDYNLCIDFYIHPKLRDQISQFSASFQRMRLVPFGAEPLNELLMECKLLVTDYSSVAWDVYYQGKPVIFYQFDLDEYNETQGSYMDLEKDLFGDRAETQEQLIELLKDAAKKNFMLDPKYAKIRKNWFTYIDKNNSKRICGEIINRGL